MARGKEAPAHEHVITDEARVSFRQRLAELQEVCGYVSGPEIFKFCSSTAVQDPCGVHVKLWADLHRFEGLGRKLFERSWLRIGVHAAVFGLEIFRFYRSWADGSSGCINFVKFFSNLHRFE